MSDEVELPHIGDVSDMDLELTKDEKRRVTALILGIKYHVETIVKDGSLYTAMVSTGKHLEPTHVLKVVDIAIAFEEYIRDGGTVAIEPIAEEPKRE